MTSSENLSKETLKQLYHELKHRIRMVLGLLSKIDPLAKAPAQLEDSVIKMLGNLINGIMSSAGFEENNQYRDAIIDIVGWMNSACQKEYLQKHTFQNPNPVLLLKKGAEILHSFFHRDLRRKQLSSDDREIYNKFTLTLKTLPDPRPVPLDADEVDSLLNNLLKSS